MHATALVENDVDHLAHVTAHRLRERGNHAGFRQPFPKPPR